MWPCIFAGDNVFILVGRRDEKRDCFSFVCLILFIRTLVMYIPVCLPMLPGLVWFCSVMSSSVHPAYSVICACWWTEQLEGPLCKYVNNLHELK